MRSRIFTAGLFAISMGSLAACSTEEAPAPAAEASSGIAGLAITDARMMLAPVAGNPAAIYMNIAYDGPRNIAIRRADVAGAGSAQLHDMMEYNFEMTMGEMPPLMLRPGDKVSFEPGGKHIMAMDVSPELAAGGTTEVTLTIAGGDQHTVEVPIMAAGDER